jgi:tight adherence protein B
VTLLLTSLALLCWPDTHVANRLRVIAGNKPHKRLRTVRRSAATATITAAVVGWFIAGIGGAIATTLLATTIRRQLRTHAKNRTSLVAVDGLAEALRSFVASLRTGAHPATAAESAAEDAHPEAATAMRAVAAATRLDGNVAAALDIARSPTLTTALSRLTTAWQLAQRHGLPLADVLDAVRRDLEQRARFTRQVIARMTGPKASALALSLLPLIGIALGETIGAHPLRLLTTTALGQTLLVTGVAFLCAGIAWSGRITNRVVHQ